jgi:hypothetical protein
MIKKILFLFLLFVLTSCSYVEFVHKDSDILNPYKNNTYVMFNDTITSGVSQELISLIGNKKDGDYILVTSFSEKKENRLVKKNQVAEKIDYELSLDYKVFYKNTGCKIFNKKIVTRFSFVPKSFGYNFGTDRSFTKLYQSSVRKNIKSFISMSFESSKARCSKDTAQTILDWLEAEIPTE